MHLLFNAQPYLSNNLVIASPLQRDDFEALYAVASDPEIWKQHPNPDRWRKDVFLRFFEGAMQSKGALLIRDQQSNEVIGSSRFYEPDDDPNDIAIGYTFFKRSHWGGVYNPALKKLMITHALETFNRVLFHIGAENIRSQKAIERLGAVKIDEKHVAYYGEPPKRNFIYEIQRVSYR